jgi:hypothetical protein
MTSAKKVAANRINGRKSRGPRTGAGKARASRNARRHGLAAFNNKEPYMARRVQQMVDVICQGDDPLLREQAVAIAESQLWLDCVKAEKLALIIERLRDPTAHTLALDTRLARARARMRLSDVANRQQKLINNLIDKTKAAGRDPEREPLPPNLEAAWPPPWLEFIFEDTERDEHEALREGIRDLVRLLRYERRAWSRRKRAVRAFMAIKLNLHGVPPP